jgi:drug/metabolite transporter (DMT)-like permease
MNSRLATKHSPDTTTSSKGVAAILIAGCMWGSVGLFVRVLDGAGYSPLTIVFARMSIAFLILAAILLLTRRAHYFKIRLKDLWCFIGTGVSSAIMLNLFYSMSTVMNSLALASILLATAPVFVVLIAAPVFKERITAVKAQALIVVFVGCVLTSGIVGGNGATAQGAATGFSAQGVAIGLLAGFGWGLYSITTRFALNRGYDALTVNIYSFLIGSLVCIPFTNFQVIADTVQSAPARMTLILIAHTLFTSLLPYMLFTYGMKFMETGKASIIASVEPVVAAILGFILYGERPSAPMIAGFILVLSGIALLNLPNGLRTFRPRK